MSRFQFAAALAAFSAFIPQAQADSFAAALTPPRPALELPTPDISNTPVSVAALPMPQAIPPQSAQSSVTEIVARQANISNFGTPCAPSIAMDRSAGAMLNLSVNAPCLPSSMVSIDHGGLSFTAPLSMTGELSLRLPAMQTDAQVKATLSDGETLETQAYVPEVAQYARVALQWQGADPGQLVATAPAILEGDLFHLGTSHGADAKVLHVFSRRIDDVTASGVVRLSLHADVTAQNCVTGQAAKVRRAVPGEPVTAYDVAIKGPGCGAIGQTLELKNVLQDLKLTAK